MKKKLIVCSLILLFDIIFFHCFQTPIDTSVSMTQLQDSDLVYSGIQLYDLIKGCVGFISGLIMVIILNKKH